MSEEAFTNSERFWGDEPEPDNSSNLLDVINARAKARSIQSSESQKKRKFSNNDGSFQSRSKSYKKENNVIDKNQDEIKNSNQGSNTKNENLLSGDNVKNDNKVGKFKRKNNRKKKRDVITEGTEVDGFTVLPDVQTTKLTKVSRVLPHWLKNPTFIEHSLTKESLLIEDLKGLSDQTQAQLKKEKKKILFPVQQVVIPSILKDKYIPTARFLTRDICVSAPTGSGKTLAYVLPIVEILKQRVVPKIRALVLLPVQELAKQVYKVFCSYGEPLGLKVGIAIGLKSIRREKEALVSESFTGVHSMVDILIATPGRLIDHINLTPGFSLASLQFLVLDEADKLLSGAEVEAIKNIEETINNSVMRSPEMIGHVPSYSCIDENKKPVIQAPLQKLLFSATLSHDPEQLTYVKLNRPMLFTVNNNQKSGTNIKDLAIAGQYTRPLELEEHYIVSSTTIKPLLLHHLIVSQSWKKTIIFTSSKDATHKLALLLSGLSENKYTVSEFSSDKGRNRTQIVNQFSQGKSDVLVSTDAMARGLDIKNVEHVVSYNLTSLSTYIHRIGRTARAGKKGAALSLISPEEVKDFKSMMIGTLNIDEMTVDTADLEVYEDLYINALDVMRDRILKEKLVKK